MAVARRGSQPITTQSTPRPRLCERCVARSPSGLPLRAPAARGDGPTSTCRTLAVATVSTPPLTNAVRRHLQGSMDTPALVDCMPLAVEITPSIAPSALGCRRGSFAARVAHQLDNRIVSLPCSRRRLQCARAVSSLHLRDFSHLGWILAGCGSATIGGSGCNSESGANGQFVRRFS